MSDVQEEAYRAPVDDFMEWSGRQKSSPYVIKARKMVIDFRRKTMATWPINVAKEYKYLGKPSLHRWVLSF